MGGLLEHYVGSKSERPSCWILWALFNQGSIRYGILVSLPCAVVAAGIKYVDHNLGYNFVDGLMPEKEAYNGFNFLLGFFVIFHTSHAYHRLMRGAEILYTVLGDLVEVTNSLFAFIRFSKAELQLQTEFKDQFVRLMSLLFAVSVGSLEGDGDVRAFKNMLIDLEHIGDNPLKRILNSKHKPEVVCQMSQALLVDNIELGVLNIPPPILTRAFAKLDDAMVKLYEVQAFRDTPFPYSLVLVTYLLLAIQWAIVPFFMCHWSQGVYGAASYTFIMVFVLHTLNNAAMVLDNPFETDASDLNRDFMQELTNESLLAIIKESAQANNNEEESPLLQRYQDSHGSSIALSTVAKRLSAPLGRSSRRLSQMSTDDTGRSSHHSTTDSSRRSSRHSVSSTGPPPPVLLGGPEEKLDGQKRGGGSLAQLYKAKN
jgi:predicted membrane chloride channel (bestrophin family)